MQSGVEEDWKIEGNISSLEVAHKFLEMYEHMSFKKTVACEELVGKFCWENTLPETTPSHVFQVRDRPVPINQPDTEHY